MLLLEIKSDVEKFAQVISKILEVEVMIVDSYLRTISNTYRYPEKPMHVHQMSIIAQVISTGKTIAIEDKNNYETCKLCRDFEKCEMKGFLSVPINYKEEVIGAIALIVPKNKIEHVFGNVNNSIEFLEQMADLLASKIQKGDDYNNLNRIKHEREVIMDSIDYAMASMDELGYITYYNKRFKQYFGDKTDYRGMFIRDVMPHRYVNDFLTNFSEFFDRLIYFERDDLQLYGFLSCMNININGSRTGMLLIFKPISDVNVQLNEIGYNNIRTTFGILEEDFSPKRVLEEAKRLSVTQKTALIQGEAGVGKDLIAKAMHSFSNRAKNCYVTVNCDSIYRELLEESLFGDELSKHTVGGLGKLQLADKGTIYFSKIEQMPVYLQKKLVETLKSGTIRRVGMSEIRVDVRMLFSTSADLKQLVRDGLFDEELYYRISENAIYVPPLRDDKESLKRLIDRRLKFYKEKYKKFTLSIDPKAMDMLVEYSWPENRRELDRVLDNIVSLSNGSVAASALARFGIGEENQVAKTFLISDMEKESISALLSSNVSKDEIARRLGLSRATLYRKIKKYNL